MDQHTEMEEYELTATEDEGRGAIIMIVIGLAIATMIIIFMGLKALF